MWNYLTRKTNLFAVLFLLIPLHVLGGWALTKLSWEVVGWFLAGYVLISGLGVAIGYHRYYSHRGFKVSRPIQLLMTYGGVLACQGSPIFWTVIHRTQHHPFSDKPGDAHSPIDGWFHSYIGWILTLKPEKLKVKGAIDLIRDPIASWFHERYYRIVWVTWVTLLAVYPPAFFGILLAQLYAFHQENFIDLFCHVKVPLLGYRNYETPDNSQNLRFLGLFTWGQALHNNHHYAAAKYNFAAKPGEVDPSAWIVNLIKQRSPSNV